MSEVARHSPGLSVLIVEDETIVGMGLSAQLNKLGHKVLGQAANGAQARTMFTSLQPDLVMLDIRLGEDDGLELARELLAVRRVPMIVLSAFSDTELINRASEVGVFGYLIKPTRLDVLAAQIEVAMQRFADQEKLREEKDELVQALETRKLMDKSKGILMKRLHLDENQAHRWLQVESQKRRITLSELAKRVIDSQELLGG
jgi:two-component system, response regulator PdtaR